MLTPNTEPNGSSLGLRLHADHALSSHLILLNGVAYETRTRSCGTTILYAYLLHQRHHMCSGHPTIWPDHWSLSANLPLLRSSYIRWFRWTASSCIKRQRFSFRKRQSGFCFLSPTCTLDPVRLAGSFGSQRNE